MKKIWLLLAVVAIVLMACQPAETDHGDDAMEGADEAPADSGETADAGDAEAEVEAPAGDNEVRITKKSADPSELTVKVGDTITFINTADRKQKIAGKFSTGYMESGERGELVATEVGTFKLASIPYKFRFTVTVE